ncbi:unnamed protein product [Protopolystoma xenopodis]|uniref:Uncharacterized protein n=1 Tax=Protopolystoma xenopodis TaxID=117903 RepID=A0A3S5CBQ6_9PLAT|nr:unnamed protein product [Protopolystoma xenopodis]
MYRRLAFNGAVVGAVGLDFDLEKEPFACLRMAALICHHVDANAHDDTDVEVEVNREETDTQEWHQRKWWHTNGRLTAKDVGQN